MGKSIGIDGQRLQELRVEQALSLRALGERSGVAYDTINKLELGRRPAHASTIRKLADALGVEPKELMKSESFLLGRSLTLYMITTATTSYER
jgi:transcriptional regulator with XRE-family HTH domain